MVQQVFNVESYWEVTVFFNVNYDLFYIIEKKLLDADFSLRSIDTLYNTMSSHRAKAVTCSNPNLHISIVLFNYHRTKSDYINSIVHEAEHIKQNMLEAYQVEDKGESPAYTIGFLVEKMYYVFEKIVCS